MRIAPTHCIAWYRPVNIPSFSKVFSGENRSRARVMIEPLKTSNPNLYNEIPRTYTMMFRFSVGLKLCQTCIRLCICFMAKSWTIRNTQNGPGGESHDTYPTFDPRYPFARNPRLQEPKTVAVASQPALLRLRICIVGRLGSAKKMPGQNKARRLSRTWREFRKACTIAQYMVNGNWGVSEILARLKDNEQLRGFVASSLSIADANKIDWKLAFSTICYSERSCRVVTRAGHSDIVTS